MSKIGMHNTQDRYGWVAIAFHWAIALLVIGQWLLGEAMSEWVSDRNLRFALFQWHKSFGLLILLLAGARILWRLWEPVPRPPVDQPLWQVRLARVVHWALYALILLMPLSGWLRVSTAERQLPIMFFDLFEVPKLMGPNKSLSAIFEEAHEVMASLILVLVLMHVAGALYHHFVRRDGVLRRMLGRT